MSNSVKITIQLTEDQMGDYPVSTESLWFDKEGDYFRLKNIPFFIDNLSYDDLVEIRQCSSDTYEIVSVVSLSKNSTVWLCINDGDAAKTILDGMKQLGCIIEGGVLYGYYAMNIPADIDFDSVYSLIEKGQENNFLVADYPSIRHVTLH